ncbi:hypothetical protein D6D01_09507 [Aureobasidium pullulans]|uniref:Uncharacterized protein n=1 Tax=Aureobasidium pullulans TaxID=5580 RepID=A0A4S9K4I4_AURPU|nr:hypothetical protein D6D01_09507 [Aureobasidium pullulans]
MNYPPNLLSLPNEVLDEICAQIEAWGFPWPEIYTHPLMFLRLTCKHLYVPATKEFAKRFLVNPHVMVNNYSLNALVEICKHPLIGSYVRGITLEAYRLCHDRFSSNASDLSEWAAEGDTEEMRRIMALLQGHMDALEEESMLEDTGRAVDLLTEALKHIKVHHNFACLSLSAKRATLPLGGNKGLGKLSGHRNHDWRSVTWLLKSRATLRMLLDAAQRSECQVDELAFIVPDGEVPYELESSVNLVTGTSIDIFAGLKSIKLELRSYDTDLTTEDLALILPIAKCISTLELAAKVYKEGEIVIGAKPATDHATSILRSVRSNALRRVHLSSLVCEQRDLQAFLDKHRSTIKELLLTEIVVVGSWNQMLEWFSDNLCLRRLEFNTLSTIDVEDRNGYDADDHHVVDSVRDGALQGEEQVRLGLMEILQKKRSADGKRLHDEEAGETEETEEIEEVEEVEDDPV